jgi:putative membrane protein
MAWFMLAWSILFLVLIVVAIVFLIRYLWRPHGERHDQTDRQHSAADVVRRRYAAGEIDRDEYLQKLKDLSDEPRGELRA